MNDQAWLDRHYEPVIDPDLPIIDPHHHAWIRLDGNYLIDDLMADMRSGHNVRATVFIECQTMYRADGPIALRPVGETEFANGIAAISASGMFGPIRACAGIVGYVDLRLGRASAEVLEAHLRAGGGRFRGIRQVAAFDPAGAITSHAAPPAGLLADPRFLEGFACLAPLKLSFDAWVYHHQLDDVAALAARFPGTRIVINHCGGLLGIGVYADRAREVWDRWHAGIQNLARCPNVFFKIGGLGMRMAAVRFYEHPDPPDSATLAETWRPMVDAAIGTFGADRCMFESNFPVDKRSYRYDVLWNGFKRLAAGCSADERHALFFGTAAEFYRLRDIAPAKEGS